MEVSGAVHGSAVTRVPQSTCKKIRNSHRESSSNKRLLSASLEYPHAGKDLLKKKKDVVLSNKFT